MFSLSTRDLGATKQTYVSQEKKKHFSLKVQKNKYNKRFFNFICD